MYAYFSAVMKKLVILHPNIFYDQLALFPLRVCVFNGIALSGFYQTVRVQLHQAQESGDQIINRKREFRAARSCLREAYPVS